MNFFKKIVLRDVSSHLNVYVRTVTSQFDFITSKDVIVTNHLFADSDYMVLLSVMMVIVSDFRDINTCHDLTKTHDRVHTAPQHTCVTI